MLIVDLIVLASLLMLAVRANRFWPMGVVALHLVGVASHLLPMLQPRTSPALYGMLSEYGSFAMLPLLALGTWNHRERLKRFGRDRSWVNSSQPSTAVRGKPGPNA